MQNGEPSLADITLLRLRHIFQNLDQLPVMARIIQLVGIEEYGKYLEFEASHTHDGIVDLTAIVPEQERVLIPAWTKLASEMTEQEFMELIERFKSEYQLSVALFIQEAMSPKRKLTKKQKLQFLQNAIDAAEFVANAGTPIRDDTNSYIERLEEKKRRIKLEEKDTPQKPRFVWEAPDGLLDQILLRLLNHGIIYDKNQYRKMLTGQESKVRLKTGQMDCLIMAVDWLKRFGFLKTVVAKGHFDILERYLGDDGNRTSKKPFRRIASENRMTEKDNPITFTRVYAVFDFPELVKIREIPPPFKGQSVDD